jgi:hypothetical protein
MPAHGKPIDFTKIKPKTTGYLGSTTHRGTQLMTPAQHRLLEARKLPHTEVYRSKKGNIYRERRYNK